ncbi:MAG: helix-turn-helix transcriptional regulator [Lachnospiraceae bacterium]
MRLQRLLAILAMLLREKRIRAEEMAQRFEVSTRTIHRDIETLEQAGVPIVTYPGVHGGIEILDTYKLDKNVFLNEDFMTILSGLKSISGALDPAVVNRTLAKLEALIPQNQAGRVELGGNKLYIDLKPWNVHPDFEPMFDKVRKGVEQDRLLRFDYTKRECGSSQRTVEPHQLILKEQNWYLRGFCRARQEFRTFRLQRMEQVELLDEVFEPRSFPEEVDDFKQWSHPKMVTVEIIAHPSMRKELLEHCSHENITELPDGNLYLRLPFVESRIGYGVLLMMGEQCRVVAPDFVKEELKRRLDRMRELY